VTGPAPESTELESVVGRYFIGISWWIRHITGSNT
jgi:hypothetical protein